MEIRPLNLLVCIQKKAVINPRGNFWIPTPTRAFLVVAAALIISTLLKPSANCGLLLLFLNSILSIICPLRKFKEGFGQFSLHCRDRFNTQSHRLFSPPHQYYLHSCLVEFCPWLCNTMSQRSTAIKPSLA